MSETDAGLTTSDEELIASARSGDQDAFAELWRRHYRSGARVARQFTSSIDADDLVSEAFTRIYQRVLAGGGPSGGFRPYLYTTIRNLASSWGAKSHDVQVDDIADYEDPSTIDDPVAIALDRTLTARAFRALPERWQSVLWYTEVEGMDPHEVAPLLGMSANGVAALSYRAREGLRKAWLQAHVSEPGTSEACKWTMSRLGDNARHGLTEREQEKVQAHLLTCTKCAIISEEVDEVGSHLAMVMLPIVLGAGVGGLVLASLTHGAAAASSAAMGALPAVPASFTVLAAPASFAPAVTAGLSMGAGSGVTALVGSLAVVAAVGGGIALGLGSHGQSVTPPVAAATSAPSAPTKSAVIAALTEPLRSGADDGSGLLGGGLGGAVDGGIKSGLGNAVGGAVGGVVGGVKTGIVDPLLGSLTPGAPPAGQAAPGGAPLTTNITLTGSGMPGAIIAAQAGGILYGTATVRSNGSFSILVTALPSGTGTLQLSQQKLTLLGIKLPITVPLSLTSSAAGLVVKLVD
jgi:RNA polymerase sigma factor (sigma-70 family)